MSEEAENYSPSTSVHGKRLRVSKRADQETFGDTETVYDRMVNHDDEPLTNKFGQVSRIYNEF